MPGPAGGVAEPALRPGRLAGRAWDPPVVVTAFAGAIEGELEPPPGAGDAVVRGPFEDVKLPGAPVAPAAQALTAALGRLLADPASGEMPPPERRAIVVGTRAAALSETIRFMEEVASSGASLVNPGLFPFTVMNAAAGLAAIHHGCAGANITLNNGMTSALDAVVYAADLVATGRASVAFAGGFEGLGEPASRALERRSPPVQVAVVLALTTLEAARAAGARPCARVAAASQGELPGMAPAASLAEIEAAALAAAEPLLGSRPPASSSRPERPEDLLMALLGALAGAPAGAATIAAAARGRSAGTALVLGPANDPGAGA